jgi:hypothetical protein
MTPEKRKAESQECHILLAARLPHKRGQTPTSFACLRAQQTRTYNSQFVEKIQQFTLQA